MASTSNKTVIWIVAGIVVLALCGFGGYKLYHHYHNNTMLQTASSAGGVSPTGSQPSASSSGLQNKKDTSNQQLDNDLQDVQNSMNQLQQDQNTSNQDTSNQSADTPQQ